MLSFQYCIVHYNLCLVDTKLIGQQKLKRSSTAKPEFQHKKCDSIEWNVKCISIFFVLFIEDYTLLTELAAAR